MRVNLIAQIFQLLLQILMLQLREPLTVVTAAEIAFDADVYAKHQYQNHDGQDIVLAYDERRAVAFLKAWGQRPLIKVRVARKFQIFRNARKFRSIRIIRPLQPLMWWTAVGSLGSAGALIYGEQRDDHSHNGEIHHTPVLIHQQRREQIVVNEKQRQEQRELTPHYEHLSPVENEGRVVDRAHIQAQQRGCKEHNPRCQVYQSLLS